MDPQHPHSKGYHAFNEPSDIVSRIDSIIAAYSTNTGVPAITASAKDWWESLKNDIIQHRVLSNPADNRTGIIRMSTSPQENYNKQIHRITKGIRVTTRLMDAILGQHKDQWNTDEDRKLKLVHNYVTYDVQLVSSTYYAAAAVLSTDDVKRIWPKPWLVSTEPVTEQFGCFHQHVTNEQDYYAVSIPMNITTDKLYSYLQRWLYFVGGSNRSLLMMSAAVQAASDASQAVTDTITTSETPTPTGTMINTTTTTTTTNNNGAQIPVATGVLNESSTQFVRTLMQCESSFKTAILQNNI